MKCGFALVLITFELVLANFIHSVSSYGSKMGPFDVVFRHFDECPDPGSREMRMSIRVRKYNRTISMVDANMTVLTDFDDSVSMKVALSQFTNGGYKDNFFNKEVPKVCTTMLAWSKGVVTKIYREAGIKGCPIKKGNYTIKNFTYGGDIEILPVFFYNKYRGEMSYFKKNKLIGCFQAFVEFVPRKKPRSGK